jgi:hypothetical protein
MLLTVADISVHQFFKQRFGENIPPEIDFFGKKTVRVRSVIAFPMKLKFNSSKAVTICFPHEDSSVIRFSEFQSCVLSFSTDFRDTFNRHMNITFGGLVSENQNGLEHH